MATKDDLTPGALGPLPAPTPPKRRLTTDEIKQVETARPKTGIVREHYTDAPPVSDGVPEPIGKDTDRVVRMDFHDDPDLCVPGQSQDYFDAERAAEVPESEPGQRRDFLRREGTRPREIIERARPYQDSRGNWCAGKCEIAGSIESVKVGGLPGGGTVTFLRKQARCNCPGDRNHYFTVWVKEGGEDRIFRCTRCYIPIVYFPPCAASKDAARGPVFPSRTAPHFTT